MVVIGPVSLQQGSVPLPPFSKVDNSVLESKNHAVSGGFSLPAKQSVPPVPSGKQVLAQTQLNMLPDYENLVMANEPSMKYDGEYSQPMSLKYAELCSIPKSVQYPEMYMGPGQYDAFFPVDTPNIIPNVGPGADFKQQAQDKPHPYDASNNQFAETDDLDLFSLLALPDPMNKEPNVYDCDPFMYGVQPELELLGSAMPDGIHYWNGFQKESSNDAASNQTAANAVESFGFPNKSEADVFPTDPTLESILLLEGGPQAMSPVNSESSLMDDGSVPSNSPGSEKWDKSLQDLFEQTFDLSDIEGDYMFPPPNKRQEAPSNSHYWAKPPPSPSPSQYWGTERKPQLSLPSQQWASERKPHLSPLTPPPPTRKPSAAASPSSQVEPMSPAPHPPQEHSNGKHTKGKPKPTLLFGKHEGEIIQKLLVANDNARSKPITRDKLITIPVEEFNQLLEEAQLSEIEVAFMKEWRRRGKNKAAAQIARKRKREEVSGLDEEVEKLREQKAELDKKYEQLKSLVQSLKERSAVAEDKLFQKQSESSEELVSRNTHLIHVTDDDKLLLIPKISSKILVVNS